MLRPPNSNRETTGPETSPSRATSIGEERSVSMTSQPPLPDRESAKETPSSTVARQDSGLDIAFSVPFVHRLRTTEDLSGDDLGVLFEVLQAGSAGPAKVLMVAESAVAQASEQIKRIEQALAADPSIDLVRDVMLVDGGESVKNDSVCVERLLEQINEYHLDRRSYVLAIGGGAMLDAVGYAAAIAHRGVRLVRVPTTTLAQGDSGVGVKNAVNYFDKKNWVGTFAVPWAVINDASLLTSLSDRDFSSGFSESVKVSLLKSREEFDWLCEHATKIRDRDMPVATKAIATSCQLHLRHITEGGDPFEMLEARPLDFGHWSAHKLEPITDYRIRHGEAVAIGVAIDCFYSSLKLGFPLEDAHRVCRCLADLDLPLWDESLFPLDRLLGGLEEFREHLGGRLTITMLRSVGESVNVHEIDVELMSKAIEMLHRESKQIAAEG